MSLKLLNKASNSYVEINGLHDEENRTSLMLKAGLTPGLGFEAFGVQSDGQIVVMDKCGNFGYLSSDEFSVHFFVAAEIAGASE